MPSENDFKNPLRLLSDCHRRIERFLGQLLLLCQEGGGQLTTEQLQLLEVTLRYFRQAIPIHNADEEESLFPRLKALAGAGEAAAVEVVARLDQWEADHDLAQERHDRIDARGRQWLADTRLTPQELAGYSEEVMALQAFYSTHIAFEDDELFPLAGRLLNGASLEAMGREMAKRHGGDYDAAPGQTRCRARRDKIAIGQPSSKSQPGVVSQK
jgi:iron-sulfur cluster repair protein YtfE (RIC family)